jgi:hypothetical protein
LDESLGLLHELADEQYIGSGTIADDVILGSGGPGDHSSSGVLDLHFVEQHVSVLGEFDLTGTSDKPIKNLKIFKYILRVPLGPRLLFITS